MKKNKWYKFAPYSDRPTVIWYMESNGSGYSAIRYIGRYNERDSYTYTDSKGNFSNYHYQEVSSVEDQWLTQIVSKGKYFPIEEMYSNNYLIY